MNISTFFATMVATYIFVTVAHYKLTRLHRYFNMISTLYSPIFSVKIYQFTMITIKYYFILVILLIAIRVSKSLMEFGCDNIPLLGLCWLMYQIINIRGCGFSTLALKFCDIRGCQIIPTPCADVLIGILRSGMWDARDRRKDRRRFGDLLQKMGRADYGVIDRMNEAGKGKSCTLSEFFPQSGIRKIWGG